MKRTPTILLSAAVLVMLATCNHGDDDDDDGDDDWNGAWGDDDDDDDNDDNDDDDNDDDNDDDSLLTDPPHDPEKPDCGGWDLSLCGTAADSPPWLSEPWGGVNGTPTPFPLELHPGDELMVCADYGFGDCRLRWGHFFLQTATDLICLTPDVYEWSCWTGEDPPAFLNIDPMLFLNGQDAPYYLVLSNA